MLYYLKGSEKMNYKIVADSSCDLNEGVAEELNISLVPFKIDIDENSFIDNEDLDLESFVKTMKDSPNPVRTSCPSPGDFVEEYKKADNIFVTTISSTLSSTYNSAILAKDIILKEFPEKFVHVFDCKSTSIGETLIVLKIAELIGEKLSNIEIVEKVEKYIDEMKTYFISEDLSNLVKNGRISKTKGLIANVLSLRPLMRATDEGEIELVENHRGSKKAFKRLVEIIGESKIPFEDRRLGIGHVYAPERANQLKKEIEERYNFKEIVIVQTKGISTAYINEKGIIISF